MEENHSDVQDFLKNYVNETYNNNIDNVNPNIEIDEKEIIIGIDLGTTNSCVSVWRNNNLEIIPDEFGNPTIPSVVSFTNKSRYIGIDAYNQKDLNPENVFYEVKRLIGRKIDDEEVIKESEFLTYKIKGDENNNIILQSQVLNNKEFTPEEISAVVLTKLKDMACNYLKRDIKKAVITIPARFTDAQRQATKDASEIAGLECVRMINEPTAAALAYGLMNRSKKLKEYGCDDDLNVIVYDFGGGTLDVSLLNIYDGMFEVLGSAGNTHFGGADFDNRLMAYCINKFKQKHNIKELGAINNLSLQQLRSSCERAKKLLSTNLKAIIAVKDFYDNKNFYYSLTRDEFEKICADYLLLSIKPIEDVLESCGMDKKDINEVILVGGMTRMPAIRNLLKNYFEKEPNCSVNPDEVVSAGASIQGYILSNKQDPFSASVVLVDIIPLSLGVETMGDVMSTIIPRNTAIPTTRKKKYSTDTDYQTDVTIRIFEGERDMTCDNIFVGEFELKGLEPLPRGIPEIEVSFSVDMNGIITVSALDLDNKNKSEITINSNKGRLSKERIRELVEEAKQFELRDKLERKKKIMYYEIDELVSNIKINVSKDDTKLSPEDKEAILQDMIKVNDWLKEKKYNEREDDEMKEIIERLNKFYGTLVLKANNNDDFKAMGSDNVQSTTVFGNEEEEDEVKQTFEKIENDLLGINNMSDVEKNELKRVKHSVVDLCNQVFDILDNNMFKLEEEDKKDLRDYINDCLLWIYTHEKPKIIEYKIKIDEINDMCNKLMEAYQKENKDIFISELQITDKKDELYKLCGCLITAIENKMLPLENDKVELLKEKVIETIDYMNELESKERLDKNFTFDKNIYEVKLNELNNMCDEMHKNINNININKKYDIFGNERNEEAIILEDTTNTATSIKDLFGL